MKKILQKVALATSLLVGTSALADSSEFLYNTKSLVGFEGGYSYFDVENDEATNPYRKTNKLIHGGIKIGAQTDNYRLFLSGRYYDTYSFDYATSIGVELQYMFNFADWANFYVGVNGGQMNIRFIDRNNVTRTINDPYYGGDAGFNVHVGDNVDLEFGARVISVDATNTQNNITYTFDTVVSGYASLIFKYSMD